MADDVCSRSRSSRRTRVLATSIVISVAILYSLPGASSEEYVVDDDWAGADFSSIQDALNASLDGDTIHVNEGHYVEDVTIATRVDIVGNGTGRTIISASETDYALWVIADGSSIVKASMNGKVRFVEVDDVSIDDATVNGTVSFGKSDSNRISNVTITNGMIGMSLSDGNTVDNVTVYPSLNGIYTDTCYENEFRRVTLVNGSGNGIWLTWSGTNVLEEVRATGFDMNGALFSLASANQVAGCNFSGNNWSGMNLRTGSNSNVITDNVFVSNGAYGIAIADDDDNSAGNVISWNRFVSNGPNASQGFDGDGQNDWSSDGLGNFWSDYAGGDRNSDGIGDTGYAVLGPGNNSDPFPVVDEERALNDAPVASIVSIAPEPALAGEGVVLDGEATDLGTVVRYVWNSSIDGEFHNGTTAGLVVNDLSTGNHTIGFKAMDDLGRWSSTVSALLRVNTRPIGSIVGPVNGSTVSGWIDINGTATDPDEDEVWIQVYLEGDIWLMLGNQTTWSEARDTRLHDDGLLNITLVVWDGLHYGINETVTIIVDNTPEADTDDGQRPVIGRDEGLIIAGIAVASVAAFAATGLGFYSLFALLFPLYSKLREESIADQETRGRIIEYIRHNPGAHFSMIKRDLDMPNGSAGYHLRVLEASGFIRARSDGFYKRFYPHGYRIPEFVLDGTEQRIVAFVQAEPGIAQKDLAARIDLSPSTVSHHIKRLKRKGVVTASRGEGINLTDEYVAVTETETAAAGIEVVEPVVVEDHQDN